MYFSIMTVLKNRTAALAIVPGIFGLLGLAVFAQTVVPRQSPKEVAERFCRMESDGKLLTPEGWREMTKLLVSSTAKPRLEEMAVIKDFVVNDPVIEGNGAKVAVQYTTLGILDARNLTFGPRGMDPEKITLERTLVLTGKYAHVEPNGTVKEVEGPLEWRIEGQAEPHISVQTAIRYLKQLRAKTSSNTLKKSADESLADLQRLQ
jgi:hypothetical protein